MKPKGRFYLQPTTHLLVVAFASLFLLLQAYATEAHFHQLSDTAAASVQMSAQAGKHHQSTGDDSDNCPLCHSLYSGQYITPNLAAWFLPVLAVSIIDATSGVGPDYDAVSHSWRGRGPPHV